MKHIILLIIFTFSILFAYSQENEDAFQTVKGKVIDYIDNFSKLSMNQSQKRIKAYRDYLGFDIQIYDAETNKLSHIDKAK